MAVSLRCLITAAPRIEEKVRANSVAALSAAGIPADGLSVDGRIVTLKGPEGSPQVSGRAKTIAASAWGVFRVNVETTAPAPAAPPPAEIERRELQTNLDDLLRLKIVEFRPNSAELTPRGRALLDEIVPVFAKFPAANVEIGGHTDSDGDDRRNQLLSERRAASVMAYLTRKGVAAARLTAAGYGEARPVADNSTVEGKQRNRRIEFKVRGN